MSSDKHVFVAAPHGWNKEHVGWSDSVGHALLLTKSLGYRIERKTSPLFHENAGEITIFARKLPASVMPQKK